MPQHLSTWAMYSGLLAAAGLPIYIHAPKFYVDEYGVGLGMLGVVLLPCASSTWCRTRSWAGWSRRRPSGGG